MRRNAGEGPGTGARDGGPRMLRRERWRGCKLLELRVLGLRVGRKPEGGGDVAQVERCDKLGSGSRFGTRLNGVCSIRELRS